MLVAKTYEAYFDLRLQQSTDGVVRDYVAGGPQQAGLRIETKSSALSCTES